MLQSASLSQAKPAVESTPASGSANIAATILVPCSMGTLARVAHGFSSNLIERSADVALKEGRPLIVVPRETPLAEHHLEAVPLDEARPEGTTRVLSAEVQFTESAVKSAR